MENAKVSGRRLTKSEVKKFKSNDAIEKAKSFARKTIELINETKREENEDT